MHDTSNCQMHSPKVKIMRAEYVRGVSIPDLCKPPDRVVDCDGFNHRQEVFIIVSAGLHICQIVADNK